MSSALSVNVFTAPEKAMVGERVRPFGPPTAFDPTTSTLIFGENDAVLVDTLTTVAEAEALANWVAVKSRLKRSPRTRLERTSENGHLVNESRCRN